MKRVNVRRRVEFGALAAWAAISVAAHAQTPPIDKIQAVAADICLKPELYGYTRGLNGTIGGQLSGPRVVAKLLDLGVSASATGQASDWKGLPATDLAAGMADYRRCSEDMFSLMFRQFYAHKSASPTTETRSSGDASRTNRQIHNQRPPAAESPETSNGPPSLFGIWPGMGLDKLLSLYPRSDLVIADGEKAISVRADSWPGLFDPSGIQLVDNGIAHMAGKPERVTEFDLLHSYYGNYDTSDSSAYNGSCLATDSAIIENWFLQTYKAIPDVRENIKSKVSNPDNCTSFNSDTLESYKNCKNANYIVETTEIRTVMGSTIIKANISFDNKSVYIEGPVLKRDSNAQSDGNFYVSGCKIIISISRLRPG